MIIAPVLWSDVELAKFEVVAYGCHLKLHSDLTKLFRESGIETFQLVEYFLKTPFQKQSDKLIEQSRDRSIKLNQVFFPFLRRLIDQNTFHFTGRIDSFQLKPLTRDLRDTLELEKKGDKYIPKRYVLPLDNSFIGKRIFKNWEEKDINDHKSTDIWFDKYSTDQWIQHEKQVLYAPKEFRDIILIEYNLAARFWRACSEEVITMVCGYPICSENTFYGYFILVWPEPRSNFSTDEQPERGKEVQPYIIEYLKDHSKKYYVPTLALLHNSIWEECIHEKIGGETTQDELIKAIDDLPTGCWSSKSKEQIEYGLGYLWEKRKALIKQSNGIKKVKDTLLFRKYNIASPGMVEVIRQIIQRAPHFFQPENGNKLPAALIYGEPGSGKDTMARLIPLFTLPHWVPDKESDIADHKDPGYFGLNPHAINMSALKPNALFGPLFQGINISEPLHNISSILTLRNKHDIDENDNSPNIFILDELNSLDVDLQGVLLRILENGEITPLFDINPTYVRHLMIGVVNEDPEQLTREGETRDLQRMRKFTGEFIGNALHELFIRGRRLRPDLFYRFRRGLYIRLPSLRERREDIPILFYFECTDAIGQEMRNAPVMKNTNQQKHNSFTTFDTGQYPVYIEFKVYETLMNPSLDWPGNVRQLQDIAMKVAVESVEEHRKPDAPNKKPGIIYVQNDTVLKILRNQFPKIFEENNSHKRKEGRTNVRSKSN